jgi:hypothetical protein
MCVKSAILSTLLKKLAPLPSQMSFKLFQDFLKRDPEKSCVEYFGKSLKVILAILGILPHY